MKSIKRFLNSLCLGLLVCLVTSLALLASPFASAADNGQMEEINENVPGVFGLGWLDRTQSFASDSANALANQLDRFFGVQRSDIEADYGCAARLTCPASMNVSVLFFLRKMAMVPATIPATMLLLRNRKPSG